MTQGGELSLSSTLTRRSIVDALIMDIKGEMEEYKKCLDSIGGIRSEEEGAKRDKRHRGMKPNRANSFNTLHLIK